MGGFSRTSGATRRPAVAAGVPATKFQFSGWHWPVFEKKLALNPPVELERDAHDMARGRLVNLGTHKYSFRDHIKGRVGQEASTLVAPTCASRSGAVNE